MKTLKQNLDELSEARRLAAVDTNLINYKVRAGHEALKRTSAERVPVLEAAVVATAMPERLLGIIPAPLSDDLAEVLTVEFVQDNGGIVASASEWVDEIAAEVEPMFPVRDRQFSFPHFARVQDRYVSDVVDKSGDRGAFKDLVFRTAICKNQAETCWHIESLLVDACGLRWWTLVMKEQIGKQLVVPDRFSGKGRIPVMVLGNFPNPCRDDRLLSEKVTWPEVLELFSRAVEFQFPLGFEPSVGAIKKMFETNPVK